MDRESTVDTMCGLFGKSRQAYYQQKNHNYKSAIQSEILLQLVDHERKLMPRIGGRKLLHKLKPLLVGDLEVGRDAFFDFLREHGRLVRKKRYRVKTTFSNHWLRKYPNLIKDFIPNGPHQLWVSDITYVQTAEGFVYLFLITDAYSRKIIGWSVSETLEAKHAVKALHMALKQLPKGITGVFHHSDRGVQYCCDNYVKLLKKNGIKISMTENGDPLENAIAERVNGILKTEWLYNIDIKTKAVAVRKIDKIIWVYNTQRPHGSINMLTPQLAHNQSGELKRHWKNYWKSKNDITENEKVLAL